MNIFFIESAILSNIFQVEEKEEAALKLQSDFSLYRATHMHSKSDYESQICRIHELEQVTSGNLTVTSPGCIPHPVPTL